MRDLGVEYILNVKEVLYSIYDEIFKQNKIRHILVRHEQGAVPLWLKGMQGLLVVGVVLVTSGPGATNAVTGLTDALMDGVSVLCNWTSSYTFNRNRCI